MRRMPLWMLWTQSRSKQGKGGQRVLEIHWTRSRSVLRGISVQRQQRLQSGILQGEIPQMRLRRPLLLLQVRQSLLRQAHQPAARRWTAKTRAMEKAEAEAEPVGLAAADRSLLAAIAKAQVSQVLRHQAQLPRPTSHEVAARAKVQARFPRPTRRRTTTATAILLDAHPLSRRVSIHLRRVPSRGRHHSQVIQLHPHLYLDCADDWRAPCLKHSPLKPLPTHGPKLGSGCALNCVLPATASVIINDRCGDNRTCIPAWHAQFERNHVTCEHVVKLFPIVSRIPPGKVVRFVGNAKTKESEFSGIVPLYMGTMGWSRFSSKEGTGGRLRLGTCGGVWMDDWESNTPRAVGPAHDLWFRHGGGEAEVLLNQVGSATVVHCVRQVGGRHGVQLGQRR